MSDYRRLEVWSKAHKLALDIYNLTNDFPTEEKFGLISQMRRAAMSIPINIAEGCGRLHKKEFIQFLNIARGSTSEVEYELLFAKDLGYIEEGKYKGLSADTARVGRMLNGLIKRLRQIAD